MDGSKPPDPQKTNPKWGPILQVFSWPEVTGVITLLIGVITSYNLGVAPLQVTVVNEGIGIPYWKCQNPDGHWHPAKRGHIQGITTYN